MAKRTGAARAPRPITPATRGANVSTQTRQGRPPLPFQIGMPKPTASDDESGLYSRPEDVIGKSAGRRVEAVAAAQRRMRGPDADDELDALGEAELPTAHAEPLADDNNDEDRATDEDAQQLIASLQQEPELASSFKQLIEDEVQRRLKALQPQQAAPVAQSAPVALMGGTTITPVPQQFIAAHTVDDTHIDRLWDWIRQDPSASATFFGQVPTTSRQLRGIVEALLQAEANGVGMIRALVFEREQGGNIWTPEHFGFTMVAPMFSEDRLALLHIFLEPKMRGRLPQLLPSLIDLARQGLPNFKLAVLPSTDVQRRLYGSLLPSLGFNTFTLFVK